MWPHNEAARPNIYTNICMVAKRGRLCGNKIGLHKFGTFNQNHNAPNITCMWRMLAPY